MPKVVIIGAGIAGISAARELTKKGFEVLVLEAQSCVGGRIKTIRTSDTIYDLGASWLHDTLTNPLFQVAVDLQLDVKYDDVKTRYFVLAPGNPQLSGRLEGECGAFQVAEDISAMAMLDYGMGKYRLPDMPLREYAIKFVDNWPLISARNKRLAPRFMQRLELWCALDWKEASAANNSLHSFGRDVLVKGGYDKIFNWVWNAVEWSKSKLRLDCPVASIESKADGSVDVKLESGELVSADAVICTIPIGVLADTHETLFPNEINFDLRNAMKNASMGALGKVILEFEELFWVRDWDQATVLIDYPADQDLPLQPGTSPLSIIDVTTEPDLDMNVLERPALMILTAPPLTQLIEKHPELAYDYVLPGLRLLRRNKGREVPPPSVVHVSDWTQNKYFRGSYSATRVSEDLESSIAAFVNGDRNLRFAGEHATFDGDGCVHGAYLSGIREANEIIDRFSSD